VGLGGRVSGQADGIGAVRLGWRGRERWGLARWGRSTEARSAEAPSTEVWSTEVWSAEVWTAEARRSADGSGHNLLAGRAGVGIGNGAGYAHGIAMKLSTLLICLGGLLSATGLGWSQMWSRRSIKQVYLEVKAGRGRVGLYAMIVAPVSLVLIIAGLYLAFTWR
jgi:hypothetical protein